MKQLRADIHRYRWLVIAACAGVLMLRGWLLRDRPERLLELDQPGSLVSVQNGQLALTEWRPGEFVIRSVRPGGKNRVIVRERSDNDAEIRTSRQLVRVSQYSGSDIFYLAYRNFVPLNDARQGPPPSPLGTFRVESTLRRVSLQGGPARDILPALRTLSVAVAGRWIYWIDAHPDERVLEATGVLRRYRTIHHSDLIATPLDGGPARKLATGLTPSIPLQPSGRGVCWSQWQEPLGMMAHLDLCYMSVENPAPVVFPDFHGAPPVEFEGRFYWVEVSKAPKPSQTVEIPQPAPGESVYVPPSLPSMMLMTCDHDGSNRRMLAPLQSARTQIFEHRGRLYVVEKKKRHGDQRTVCYRVEMNRQNPLREIGVLPDSYELSYVDSGYFYFIVDEQRENWLDWSQAGLSAKHVPVLYRWRLPV